MGIKDEYVPGFVGMPFPYKLGVGSALLLKF